MKSTNTFDEFWQTDDRTKARLRIWDFDGSAADITAKLRLDPMKIQVKGEPIKDGHKAVWKQSLWAYEDDLDDTQSS